MALETYQWPLQRGGGAVKYTKTVRSAQFDDGYSQDAESGINSTMIECPLIHVGNKEEVYAIRAFLLRHIIKAFAMAPPGEELGLYRVVKDSITVDDVSQHVATIAWTVKRAYGVYA